MIYPEINFKPKLQVINTDQITQIHFATMNHFREVWYPQIFDRMIHDAWLEQGAKDFEERLQEQTKKMMAHHPNPLPAEIQKELGRMAKHWK
jgi:trimethylamine--corrinoid protein Co-methyltransferase